jgi:cytochrome P450
MISGGHSPAGGSAGAMIPGMLGADITLAQLDRDPHPVLARLREREPVSWLPALGGSLITRYDLALEVMRDPPTFTVDDARFSTAQVVGPSMLSLDGEEHARHRAPFVAPFRPGAVRERFTGEAAGEAERLIDAIAPAGGGELRRSFAGPLAASIVTSALGLDRAESPAVLGWYDAIVAGVTSITAGEGLTASAQDAFAALRARLRAVIAGDSLLAAVAADGRLSEDEIVSNAAVLLFGGIETTEGMIANAVLHLLERPDQLALVRREPELVGAAIEESLRLEPAAAVVDRYATRDVQLGGASITRGDLVRVSITAANRDPAVFDEPDRFDLGRPRAKSHLAFAQGPHVCVGIHLARLEAQIGIRCLLERFPDLRLDPDHPSPVRGIVFRKPPELNAVWETP